MARKLSENVKKIRSLIRQIPDEYERERFWVRDADDIGNPIWVGYRNCSSRARLDPIVELLVANGFRCEFNGIKGTVGEYIIDVFPLDNSEV